MVPVIPEGPAGDLGKQLLSEKRQGQHRGWRRGESGGSFWQWGRGEQRAPVPHVVPVSPSGCAEL